MAEHRATVTIEWHAVNGASGRKVIEVNLDRLMEELLALPGVRDPDISATLNDRPQQEAES